MVHEKVAALRRRGSSAGKSRGDREIPAHSEEKEELVSPLGRRHSSGKLRTMESVRYDRLRHISGRSTRSTINDKQKEWL
jgi:hypothetical protein